ncbi:hypothetical protein BG262_02700 [Floricoccus penangensis]|uniref:Uncharacterized protein n=1 Tax=Floricoccus penangensis TaxID=1859475 RepID=A0A9Q5JG88_9LACT|nr:hypothetical protein BG262_02700 [Floricoccus penangensis]
MPFRTIKIKNRSRALKKQADKFEKLCIKNGYSYEIVIDNTLNLIPRVYDENGKLITSPGSCRIELDDESRILTYEDRCKHRSSILKLALDNLNKSKGDSYEIN